MLSSIIEADHFVPIPESCQRAILKDCLGDVPELIDSIIQSVMVSQIPTGLTCACVEYCSIFIFRVDTCMD